MAGFLYDVAKGIDGIAERIGIADAVRDLNVQEKSEKAEKKVLDPVFDNTISATSLIVANWQLVVVGIVAVIVLIKD